MNNVVLPILMVIYLVLATHSPVRGQVAATATVIHSGNTWAYTVFNLEPVGSNLFLASFNLTIAAPISSIAAPSGWDFTSDFASFVTWFNLDGLPPYPNDIAPGSFLDGFIVTSLGVRSVDSVYGIVSWDHEADFFGPTAMGTISAPGIAPEPQSHSFALFLGCIVFLIHLPKMLRSFPERQINDNTHSE